MTGYVGFSDTSLPKAIENVENTTVPESPDAFSEADKARDCKFCYVLLLQPTGV